MNDVISDFLARIRNAQMVKSSTVAVVDTKMTRRIAKVMIDQGYIGGLTEVAPKPKSFKTIDLALKYDKDGQAVIDGMKRISKPSLRTYCPAKDMPNVRGGLGMAIVSTSKGVVTGVQAKKAGLGGEVLCYVW